MDFDTKVRSTKMETRYSRAESNLIERMYVVHTNIWFCCLAFMGGTSVAMTVPTASGGRVNRLSSSGSTSSGFSQSPGGGATNLQPQALSTLFAKPDPQPCEVSDDGVLVSFMMDYKLLE